MQNPSLREQGLQRPTRDKDRGLQRQPGLCAWLLPQRATILLLITQREATERWGFGGLVQSGAINHSVTGLRSSDPRA